MSKKIPKRIFQVALIGGSIISLFFVPWILVWAWILPLPDTVEEQLQQGIDHGFDGIVVYVDQAGKEPAHYTAGWHDRANKIPAKPKALFKIASISKLYIAVAITKLAHRGQLDLNQTLAYYFPDLTNKIEYADQIELRMMVQHRSGIPNFTDMPDFWISSPDSREACLELVFDQPALFKPGKDYVYSNTNYLLLRMLIEKISGISHEQYIKEEILIPNGLVNTYGGLSEVQNMDELMSGYYVGVEEDLKTNDMGTMIATAEDVGSFLRALNEGSLFEEGEQEIYDEIYVYNHTGLIPGYQSIAKYHPDLNAVIIQFVNTTNFSGYTWNTSEIVYNRVVQIVENNAQ